MSYAAYANFRMNQAMRVPFADFVQPMSYVGETVHTAFDAAMRWVGMSFRATKIRGRERAAINALSSLDDRMLNDIGVPRSEIGVLARKAAENPGFDHRALCR